MLEAKALNSVAEFHRTFQHPILDEPQIPDAKRCALRVSLLAEELDELSQAIKDKDLTEIADALCDLQYVLSGAILEFGLGKKFSDLFAEVQRSNMSKACKTEDEAKDTVQHYLQKDGTKSYYVKKRDLFLVYREPDNKTLKSVNYSPTDFSHIVNL